MVHLFRIMWKYLFQESMKIGHSLLTMIQVQIQKNLIKEETDQYIKEVLREVL